MVLRGWLFARLSAADINLSCRPINVTDHYNICQILVKKELPRRDAGKPRQSLRPQLRPHAPTRRRTEGTDTPTRHLGVSLGGVNIKVSKFGSIVGIIQNILNKFGVLPALFSRAFLQFLLSVVPSPWRVAPCAEGVP